MVFGYSEGKLHMEISKKLGWTGNYDGILKSILGFRNQILLYGIWKGREESIEIERKLDIIGCCMEMVFYQIVW